MPGRFAPQKCKITIGFPYLWSSKNVNGCQIFGSRCPSPTNCFEDFYDVTDGDWNTNFEFTLCEIPWDINQIAWGSIVPLAINNFVHKYKINHTFGVFQWCVSMPNAGFSSLQPIVFVFPFSHAADVFMSGTKSCAKPTSVCWTKYGKQAVICRIFFSATKYICLCSHFMCLCLGQSLVQTFGEWAVFPVSLSVLLYLSCICICICICTKSCAKPTNVEPNLESGLYFQTGWTCLCLSCWLPLNVTLHQQAHSLLCLQYKSACTAVQQAHSSMFY